jgi:putative FmdB family regulatory protein
MPTYDYRCKACAHEFEEFQSMSAKPLKKCPACGKQQLERLIGTGAGVIFKGGGFYETDYRSDSYKKAAEADTKSQSGGSDPCACGSKTKSECATGAASSTETKAPAKAEKPAPESKPKAKGSKKAD